jgi:hypothetical protein
MAANILKSFGFPNMNIVVFALIYVVSQSLIKLKNTQQTLWPRILKNNFK